MKKMREKVVFLQLLCLLVGILNPIRVNASQMLRQQYDHNTSLDYEQLYVENNRVTDNDPNTINNLLKLVPELNPFYIKNGTRVYVKDSAYSIENLILTPTSFAIAKGAPNTIEITMNILYITPDQNYFFDGSDNGITATLSVGTNPFMTFDYSHTRFKKGNYVGNNLKEIYGAHAYHFVNGKVEEIPITHISESSELDGYTTGLRHVYFQVESGGQTTNEYTSIEIIDELTIRAEIKLLKVDEDGNPLAGAKFEVKDQDGNIIEPGIITDANGQGSITVNKEGTYQITEVEAPSGYELTTPPYSQTVSITYSGQEVTLNGGNGIVNNKIKMGQIDLLKVDENANPLAGAEFTIYDADNKAVATLVTDVNGYAISGDLPLGSYTIKETKAPQGYQLSSPIFSQSITIDQDGQIITLNNGKGIINKELSTITPEKPLIPGIDIPTVEPREGLIDLLKVDQDNKPLAGAEFTIYDKDNKAVATLVTDANGYAISEALPLGTYTVKETKAPSGYELNHQEYTVEINETGEIAHVNDGTAIINHKISTITPEKPLIPGIDIPTVEPREGLIDLLKVDQDNKPLAGAEFTIYDKDNKAVATLVTDANGYAISEALPLGTYTVKETKAPSGYELNHQEYTVEINETGEIAHVNDGTAIINHKISTITPEKPLIPGIDIPTVEPREGLIDLLKVDQDNKPLAGAEFTVYDTDNKAVATLVTDANGYAISEALPLGTYTVKETKAPSGYELNHQEYTVEINETGEIAHVNDGTAIINHKISTITPEKPLIPGIDIPTVEP